MSISNVDRTSAWLNLIFFERRNLLRGMRDWRPCIHSLCKGAGHLLLVGVIGAAHYAAAGTYNCTTFSLPDGAVANGINNSGVVVGVSNLKAFIRDAQGNVTYVNYPGAAQTVLHSINNNGVSLGSAMVNGSPLFFTSDLGGNLSPVNVPAPYNAGLYLYSLNGINDLGAISGSSSSFFILNANGTVTDLGPATGANAVRGLNNSGQLIEMNRASPPFTAAFLRQPDNSLIPIRYFPDLLPVASIQAAGLNNKGAVVGITYLNSGPAPGINGALGFLRDSDGTYSDLVCGGPATFRMVPLALNDNGLITGQFGAGAFIATPQPGSARIDISPSSLDFGTVISGKPASALSVTISNTGNARLDIGSIELDGPTSSARNFLFSRCNTAGVSISSLGAGENCVVSVTPVLNPSYTGKVTDLLTIDDSSPDSPQHIGLSMYVTAGVAAQPPSCSITGNSEPARQLTFVLQDRQSGIDTIQIAAASNAVVNIPPFAAGTTTPVTVTATPDDSTSDALLQLNVTNVEGRSTSCQSLISAGPVYWHGSGGVLISNTAVAANADGRLEAFGVGTDQALWHNVQAWAQGPWQGWTSLGGRWLIGDPAVGVDRDGRLEVFTTSSDSLVWTLPQTAPGSFEGASWRSLASGAAGSPRVVRNSDGRLEFFVRAITGQITFALQSSAGSLLWQGQSTIGGIFCASDPAAALHADGRAEVLVIGSDHALWHIAQTAPSGPWGAWTSLGGYLKGNPAVVSGAGKLYVFGRGGDDALWFRAESSPGSSAWFDWAGLGGVMIGDPAAAVNADGRVEALVIGTNQSLWRIAQATPGNEEWSEWSSLGGYITGDRMAAILDPNALIDTFAIGGDGGVWNIFELLPGYWN